MPGIFYQPVDRRRFLTLASQSFAALTLSTGLRGLGGEPAANDGPAHLALLSDTHIPADPKNGYRDFLPQENLKTVVPQVAAVRPDGVILNGDAARLSGELADYDAVKALLAPLAAQSPIFIGLGNHDDRENFEKTFQRPSGDLQKVSGKHVLVIDRPGMRFIVLDSLLHVNKTPGHLGKAQRLWLGQYLEAADDRPVVIFVHHTLGDGDGELLDVEALFKLVRPQRKVKAIVYGHSHKYAFAEDDGLHLINIPAVGYNFNDAEPVGWVDAKFTGKGADFTLKAIGGNRANDGKTTSLAWRS